MTVALEANDIDAYYGKAQALRQVSLEVGTGETVGILGRNGAGKTTLLKSLMGIEPPEVRSGTITLHDEDITGRQPFEIARQGVGYVPEGREVFPELTVEENLTVGEKETDGRTGGSQWTRDRVFDAFPRLETIRTSEGKSLSGGERQMLAIGRTLMGNPSILLLDEPSEGLAPNLVTELQEQLEDIESETTLILAEQNTRFGLALSDRVYVLEEGEMILEGTPDELRGEEEFERRVAI